jgi:hypothetical protein
VETEIKTCELCGRLFVRVAHPQVFHSAAGHLIELPPSADCPRCILNPPKEEEVPVVFHSYRVVGVRF